MRHNVSICQIHFLSAFILCPSTVTFVIDLTLQLLTSHHQVPNIPLPQQPEMPQGAGASLLTNSPWEFPRNRVDLQVILGSGAFGLVMKGQAQGIKGCVGKMYVAVKIVKGKALKTSTCFTPWQKGERNWRIFNNYSSK